MHARLFSCLAALGLVAAAAQAAPPRGSAEEKAEFEKHRIASDRLGSEDSAKQGNAAKADGEVRPSLAPGERPSLRFMKKPGGKMKAQSSGAAPAEPAAPALVNKSLQPPSDFTIEYQLDADAAVTVSIVGPDGAPLREFSVPAGGPGGQRGKNSLIAWDGRDALGREAPAGSYQAIVVVRPGPGVPEDRAGARIIPLIKARR